MMYSVGCVCIVMCIMYLLTKNLRHEIIREDKEYCIEYYTQYTLPYTHQYTHVTVTS